ncbi:MAG: RNA-binding domain-containing protein [Candidatus Geothermarchaeales archaeon]
MSPRRQYRRIEDAPDELRVEASTVCHPTEDMERVKKAMLNIVDAPVEVEGTGERTYVLKSSASGRRSADKIRFGFRSRMVLMVVRKHLKSRVEGNHTRFMLNKQAAYGGVISVSEEGESPLGPIWVTITSPEIRKLIDWMTRF